MSLFESLTKEGKSKTCWFIIIMFFIYIVSSVTHNLNLKMWKGNECAAGKIFSNLAFQTAHGRQMRQPFPKKYTLPPNRPPPPWKCFWTPPKIQNFQIPTPPPNPRRVCALCEADPKNTMLIKKRMCYKCTNFYFF